MVHLRVYVNPTDPADVRRRVLERLPRSLRALSALELKVTAVPDERIPAGVVLGVIDGEG